mgnify:CR=1 FL=1
MEKVGMDRARFLTISVVVVFIQVEFLSRAGTSVRLLASSSPLDLSSRLPCASNAAAVVGLT